VRERKREREIEREMQSFNLASLASWLLKKCRTLLCKNIAVHTSQQCVSLLEHAVHFILFSLSRLLLHLV
jgi:hypothetical protein